MTFEKVFFPFLFVGDNNALVEAIILFLNSYSTCSAAYTRSSTNPAASPSTCCKSAPTHWSTGTATNACETWAAEHSKKQM